MSEVAGSDTSINYDNTRHTVTVIVKPKPIIAERSLDTSSSSTVEDSTTSDNQLKVSVIYDGNVANTQPTFENTTKETPPPVDPIDPIDPSYTLTINAVKMMDNQEAQGKDFTFELLEDGQVIKTVNNRNSKVSFTLRYSRRSDIGTHYYTIREVNGGDNGIVYDTSEFEIVVEVTKSGEYYFAKILDKYTPVFNNYTYVPEEPVKPTEPSEPTVEPSEPSSEPSSEPTPSEPEKEKEPEVKPIDKTPQTSDENNLAFWLGILGASAIGLVVALIFERRNRYQPKHYR